MADSRLQTSLHLVSDLALFTITCTAVICRRTNKRQTRVHIAQVACAVGLPHIVKYSSIQSICGVAVILSHVFAALIG